uniref:Reverse transcriptase domain-containing protein n=1 Tax=Haemonchus contortus TaxID=6289 RepID=A0A7I4Z1G1_HAECO
MKWCGHSSGRVPEKLCLRRQQGQQLNHGGEDRHEGGVLDNNISETLGETRGGFRRDREAWLWNDEVQQIVRQKKLANKRWRRTRAPEDLAAYRTSEKLAKAAVAKAMNTEMDALYEKLDSREGEKFLFRLAEARHHATQDIGVVKSVSNREGAILRKPSEATAGLIDLWTENEVRRAMGKMKVGKAPGPDGVPIEAWKASESTMDVITEEPVDGPLKTILCADDIALLAVSKEELQDKLQNSTATIIFFVKQVRLVELEGCRDSQCQVSTSNSVDHPQTDSSGEFESIPPRVTVIGGINLSGDALSVLDLGPSFAQVRSIGHEVPRRVLCGLQALQDNLRRNAKLRENPRERLAKPNFPAIPFPSQYFRPQDPNPTVDMKFRLSATSVYEILRRNIHRRSTSNLTASQKRGLNELIDLVNSKTIKISVSDKGGEFVVMPRSLDIAITESHLQDLSLYRPSSENEYKRQYRRLNRVWSDIARNADLPKTVSTRLRCDLPVCPVLYVLVKTHKLAPNSLSSLNPMDFKVRPIISSVGGPTDRIPWLLNLVLAQLLTFIPAHLSNTMKFLDQLRETRFRRNHVIESFDVTSLYTNVSNGDAMQATHELLNTHAGSINMYGLSVSQVMTLVKKCLDCSIFRWSGRYFKQVRGLAMGQRLAPVLAIAYMSKIEKPVLDRRPVLYCRYVDDCFVACSTQKEMDKCFELLNSQADNIRFTREKLNDKWLPFLNMQVQLERGFLRTKWYRKPTSKNILVHSRSAHPRKIKRAITVNMIRTAKMV